MGVGEFMELTIHGEMLRGQEAQLSVGKIIIAHHMIQFTIHASSQHSNTAITITS